MKKWLIPGLRKGNHETDLEKLLFRVGTYSKNYGDMFTGQRSQLAGVSTDQIPLTI